MKTLADLEPQTIEFYLKHPTTNEAITTDEGDEICWNVVGMDSNEYIAASSDYLKWLEKLGKKVDKLTKAEYDDAIATQLSKIVIGWDEKFNDYMGGKFTNKLAEDIMINRNRWIRNQLDSFVAERDQFFIK